MSMTSISFPLSETLGHEQIDYVNLTEEELVVYCQNNNVRAQKELYKRYVNPMYKLCYRYLKEQFATEDVLIGAFYKVYQKINGFEYKGPGCLPGWIRRIMVNESLMYLRKYNKLVFNNDYGNNDYSYDAQIDSGLQAEAIYQAISNLPTGYRTVFNLYVIEGYSHKEIAELLNINEGTSKSQLSKAKAILRKTLIKNGYQHEF